jgi:hypothetical protein
MKLPSKEELKNERLQFGFEEGVIFGGENEGVMNFAQGLNKSNGLSRADEIFLEFLLFNVYPYELQSLVIWWCEFVRRDGFSVHWKDDRPVYIDNYSEKQIENMALAWFDRRLGKLVRIGALNCSIDTNYFNSLKQSFKFENIVKIIEQKLKLKLQSEKEGK